ncbi:MAG: NADH-quinone oxidoreductase subunit M [Phycisphaerales bacterium]|nr:NADH-quinone oxidoreductase subunit M [Phycisphaerales bacterium]
MISWLLILLPLLGSIVIIVSPGRLARQLALVTSLVVFGVSVAAAVVFDGWGRGTWDFSSSIEWVKEWGLVLQVGADSVSLILVLLTTFLMPLAILGSFNAIQTRRREYYGWLLGLQAAMTGVFLARDLVLFYVCFEFTLVPMFFIIAIWGSKNRARASVKFLIYTFTGSLITLAAFLTLAWSHAQANGGQWSFEIAALSHHAASALSLNEQAWLLLALMIGFGVKVPLFPVHTWLPLAHTEAPTAGSVILAGVLLKLGTYGLYRFVLPMCPEAVVEWAPFVAVLSIIGILYAALICWVQTDVKKLIAYSSVSHLGFCVLGLFALNPMGVEGSILYMINHGLSTGALFFLIGMMYERYHTREMGELGGLARTMPIWATFMVFFVLASVGLPGLNGFVSEFLCLIAAFTAGETGAYPGVLGPWYAAIAALGMVLAAMYLLIMVGKVVFGPTRASMKHDEHSGLPVDLTVREITVLVPLAIGCVVLGIQPDLVIDNTATAVADTLAVYQDLFEDRVAGTAAFVESAFQGGAR